MLSFFIYLLVHFSAFWFQCLLCLLVDPGGDFHDAYLDGDNRDVDPDEMYIHADELTESNEIHALCK